MHLTIGQRHALVRKRVSGHHFPPFFDIVIDLSGK
jgi:hypothetical protein